MEKAKLKYEAEKGALAELIKLRNEMRKDELMDAVIKKEKKICPVCMEEHDVKVIRLKEHTTFKNRNVLYDALYTYCDNADEYYMDEEQTQENDIRLKDAYRRTEGLLTSTDIGGIRIKYGITQGDLCTLLGWGGKTITRYESHQVQDRAHDTILKKIDRDPEWFITLLKEAKDSLTAEAYQKYLNNATALYEAEQEQYLRKAILAGYLSFCSEKISRGESEDSLERAKEVSDYVLQRLNSDNRMEEVIVMNETRNLFKAEFEEKDKIIRELSEKLKSSKEVIETKTSLIERLKAEIVKLGGSAAVF